MALIVTPAHLAARADFYHQIGTSVAAGPAPPRPAPPRPAPSRPAAPARQIKAHEFHYSSLENLPADSRFAYQVERGWGITGKRCSRRIKA